MGSSFTLCRYPTPIVKPLWPFMVAAGITFFGVNYVQNQGVSTPEARKDPKNPYGKLEQAFLGIVNCRRH